jgi:hypothetical protein
VFLRIANVIFLNKGATHQPRCTFSFPLQRLELLQHGAGLSSLLVKSESKPALGSTKFLDLRVALGAKEVPLQKVYGLDKGFNCKNGVINRLPKILPGFAQFSQLLFESLDLSLMAIGSFTIRTCKGLVDLDF